PNRPERAAQSESRGDRRAGPGNEVGADGHLRRKEYRRPPSGASEPNAHPGSWRMKDLSNAGGAAPSRLIRRNPALADARTNGVADEESPNQGVRKGARPTDRRHESGRRGPTGYARNW